MSNVSYQGNGRLTLPYEAQIIITENDSPYGELEIVSSSSLSSSVDIEETQSIVKAKIIRSKGDFGRITLNYQTTSHTANSSSGNVVHFEKLQLMKTMGAYSWHTFSAFGDQFVLLASNNRTGALPEGVDDSVVSEYLGSALFRWQGVLVPLQVCKSTVLLSQSCFRVTCIKDNDAYLRIMSERVARVYLFVDHVIVR